MSKESKARIKAAEAAFFSTRRRIGAENMANLRSGVQELAMGADKEGFAKKYGFKINHKHNLLNNIWRQEEFKEWVNAVQDDLNETIQKSYVDEHAKREILSKMDKLEMLSKMARESYEEKDRREARNQIHELNIMEGHIAPTKTEIKDTTEELDDAELDAQIAELSAAQPSLKH